jgi:LysR family hydrogen peroxide-inducible transcriptional activator
MSTLTLRQLQYFLAVAELRHFGRAADRCCVTQPALSTQIRDLEVALGVQLVDRRRGHLDLTAEGRDMVHHAQAILTAVREMQECARGHTGNPVGTLRLGVIPSLAPYVLPPLLPELQTAYPDLHLEIHEHVTQSLVAGLLEGVLDAIVLAVPMDDPQIETMDLFEDRFLLARRREIEDGSLPRSASETIRTEKLLLLHDGHCLRDQAISYCQSVAQPMLSEFGASSLATIMRMVASGYGATLLPEIAAEAEGVDSRIELVPLDPPEPRRIVGLGWRRTSSRKREFQAIGALMAKICAPRPRRDGRPLPLPIEAVLPPPPRLRRKARASADARTRRGRSLCEG